MISTMAFLEGMLLGLAGLMLVCLIIGWLTTLAARPHDTRMNTQQMIYSAWSRWLDHKERAAARYIEQGTPPTTAPPLADPVKRVQIRAPENAIEGTWWECESPAQQRALVALFGDREIVEVKEK